MIQQDLLKTRERWAHRRMERERESGKKTKWKERKRWKGEGASKTQFSFLSADQQRRLPVMAWHVSSQSALFAAQLGCRGNQHILVHLLPLFFCLFTPIPPISPPLSPSPHLTPTYINLFFVQTQKRSQVECIEVSLKMWHQASSFLLLLCLVLVLAHAHAQNVSRLLASVSSLSAN